MNSTIVRLTARQLLGQKRTVLMVGFALLPVIVTLIWKFAGEHHRRAPDEWAAQIGLASLVMGLVLPFTALVFGTAALGQEFEDGTAVYLLSKPIKRRAIIFSKLLVAWVATVVVVMLSTLPTGLIAIGSDPPQGIVLGFVIGGIIGSLVYCAGFLWLSIATSRALIVGLLYVFIWEGVVVNLFSGVRFLSVRQYTLGIAGAFINAPRSVFDPDLAAASAFILSALATVLAVWFAVRGLRRWEIGEAS